MNSFILGIAITIFILGQVLFFVKENEFQYKFKNIVATVLINSGFLLLIYLIYDKCEPILMYAQ